ncbi:hypothetical protein [Clostridium sporogenes]|nr:hypothetical protein [Clostridium sporogenes]
MFNEEKISLTSTLDVFKVQLCTIICLTSTLDVFKEFFFYKRVAE